MRITSMSDEVTEEDLFGYVERQTGSPSALTTDDIADEFDIPSSEAFNKLSKLWRDDRVGKSERGEGETVWFAVDQAEEV